MIDYEKLKKEKEEEAHEFVKDLRDQFFTLILAILVIEAFLGFFSFISDAIR